ncbi:unnamed protein product [Leptosia nina]|uniref:Uncharacterized protein n=1 Tax=Leptosia nina TaxID=320188 RepID=A0AAV1J544_9NEOP
MSNETSPKADAQHGDEITESEPKTGSTDIKAGSTEPKTGSTEPKSGSTEPKTGSTDIKAGNTETKEPKDKRTVSFNRDVHVKRFGEFLLVVETVSNSD